MAATVNNHTPQLEHKQCKTDEFENILGFLRHHNPRWRFCGKAKRILSEIIHNLKRGETVKFKVGHGHTIEATVKNKLVETGLIEWDAGYHVRNAVTKFSTISPTPLFSAVVRRYCQARIGEDKHLGHWQDANTLQELIDFNSFATGHEVTYAHGTLDPAQRFNYLPDDGGFIRQRLINPIHSIKKTVRPTVKIGGEPTIQFDVVATHPQLLFHKCLQKPMDYDPYAIAEGHSEAEALRSAAKLAMMMMLNTSTRKSAGAAFRKALRKLENENIAGAVDRFVETQIIILDKVFERNPLLQPYFYQGMWRELMHWEANIAWACMQRLASEGILALTVHDEVIVQQQHLQTALAVYKQCWIGETGIGGMDIEPKIKVKDGADKP